MAEDNRDEKRRAGQDTKRASDTVKGIMGTYEGRWWMCETLAHCNMYADTYRDDGDIYGALKRDGRANVGRYLLGQIDEYAPNEYQRLIREMRARNVTRTEAAEKAERSKTAEDDAPFEATMDGLADRQAAIFQAAEAKRAREAAALAAKGKTE